MSCGGGRSTRFFALHLADGFFEHGGVHLEADGFDVAGLFAAEHVACAAELEVEGGDLEAGAEVGEFLEGGEAAAGDFGEFLLGRDEEVGVGAAIAAAYAAAELVELDEAVAVGAVDDDGVGEGDVEAVFDDGGGDEDVVLVIHEGEHDAFEFGFGELAVADDDAGGGDEFADFCGEFVDGFDAVVDEVDLAAALELHSMAVRMSFSSNLATMVWMAMRSLGGVSMTDMSRRPMSDMCSVRGMGVADMARTSISRAHLLEALFVADAEALLFVDDEEAEVLELEVFREEAVGADEDVDSCLLRLFRG